MLMLNVMVLDHACIYLFLSLPKKDNLKHRQILYFLREISQKKLKHFNFFFKLLDSVFTIDHPLKVIFIYVW